MPEKTIVQKLAVKPGQSILFVNAPRDYSSRIGSLPESVTVVKRANKPVDVIQIFTIDRAQLEQQLPQVKDLLTPKGMLWVTYYKGTSAHATDINRDTIAAYARSLGFQPVAMISIDEDWSALRLKRSS